MKDYKRKKYEIIYWSCGDQKKATIEAINEIEAQISFYMHYLPDDIVSIKEVKNDVL